jgi:hypothetical protein
LKRARQTLTVNLIPPFQAGNASRSAFREGEVMGTQSFLASVREFIGGIGWHVFLWSIKMTDEEYIDAVIRDNAQQPRKPTNSLTK